MAPPEDGAVKERKPTKAKVSRKPKSPRKADRGKRKRTEVAPRTELQKLYDVFKREIWPHLRKHMLIVIGVVFVLMLLLALYLAGDVLDPQKTPMITEVVGMKFAINGTSVGTVEIGLFGTVCPLTVQNFIMLVTHEKGYGYKGSRIHTIIPYHLMMGGDITHGNGTGGRSALDQPFENENYKVRHTGPGYVGMVPLPGNRNSSKSSIFYITMNAMPQLDGTNVAFGKVVKGMEVIKKIEAVEMDESSVPMVNVTIEDTFFGGHQHSGEEM